MNHGRLSVLLAGALIFVAYEGFQLITNAVCKTRRPERNILLGIYGSIVITSLTYVAIAIIAVGNLDAAAIHEAQEYAFAVVAPPVFGRAGPILVGIAAMLATSSAINATLLRLRTACQQDGDRAPGPRGVQARSERRPTASAPSRTSRGVLHAAPAARRARTRSGEEIGPRGALPPL